MNSCTFAMVRPGAEFQTADGRAYRKTVPVPSLTRRPWNAVRSFEGSPAHFGEAVEVVSFALDGLAVAVPELVAMVKG